MTNELLDEPRQEAPRNPSTPVAARAPAFSIMALEPRILRSATAIETPPEDQPIEGDAVLPEEPEQNVQTGTDKHDTLTGTDGNDWMEGLGGNDKLLGDLGDDVLDGGDGHDHLFGGGGDDHLHGGDGPDKLDGGDGFDLADYGDSDAGVTINLATGKGSGGDASGEKLTDIEGVIGSAHADTLTGDQQDNQLLGGDGNDQLTGGGGDDILIGGAGADTAHFSGKSTDYEITQQAGGQFTVEDTRGIDGTDTVDGVESLHFADGTFSTGQYANHAPSDLSLIGTSVAENAGGGTLVGHVAVKDVDANDSHHFSLADDAGGRFTIDEATGEIHVADGADLNYESAKSHTVDVLVTDSGGASYHEKFAIGVTNVNELPNDLALSTNMVNENATAGTVVGTVTTKDPDAGDKFTYSLSDNAGGRFTIDATSGRIRVAKGADLNFESDADHDVTVQVKDKAGGTYSETFTIGVKNVNEKPDDLTITGGTVKENSAAGTVVGKVAGSDPDLADKLTYSLTNSAGGKFAINSATGEITVAKGAKLDYESAASHNITVRVKDAGGKYYDESFKIAVEGVNEKPSDLSLKGGAVSENAATGAVVGQVTVKDADKGDAHTYALVNDAGGRFTIDAKTGEIRVADGSKLDYETARSHNVTVRVSDAGGLSYDESFKLNVKNVNEAPTDLKLTANQVNENATAGTVVGKVTTKDQDKGETLTYALTDDAGGRFTIDAKNGQIKVAAGADLDYEKDADHDVTVQVKDSAGHTYAEKFTIGVKNVNEKPVDLAMTGGSVKENASAGTVVGKVAGTDPDQGDKLTYSLTNSAGGKFAINAKTGEVTVAKGGALDFESASSQNITVRVKDARGKYYDESFQINVENVNERPQDLTLTGDSVVENAAAGTVVGQVAAKEPDQGDAQTYSLVNDAGGRFTIDAGTGEIRVADGSRLDYESAASHDVTVRVTDSGGLSYDETFKLNVQNVNEAPTDLSLHGDSVEENAAAGTVVGQVTAQDADQGDTLTYALSDDAEGRFVIDAKSGAITVAPGAELDFEQDAAHPVTVRVTDAEGKSYEESFVLKIDDVNEAVIAVEDDAAGSEDRAITTDNVLANDYDLDGDAVAVAGFTPGAHGKVVYNGDGSFTYTPDKDFSGADSFTYTVTDARGFTSEATVHVQVGGVADSPVLQVSDVTLSAGDSAPLHISAALGDLDGSESLLVRIENVPQGATLSAGTHLGNGVWTLSADELENLQIALPQQAGGDVQLKVTVIATEADGDQVEVERVLALHVAGFQSDDQLDKPPAPFQPSDLETGGAFGGAAATGERPTWPMLPALNAVDPAAAEHFFGQLQNSPLGGEVAWDAIAPHAQGGDHAPHGHDGEHDYADVVEQDGQPPSATTAGHYAGQVATSAPQGWLAQVGDRFSWLWGMFWAYGGTRPTDAQQVPDSTRQHAGR